MDYYVKRGEGEKGPFAASSLSESLDDGSLKGSTLVRAADSQEWVRLDSILGAIPARRAPRQ